tara:strand:+ start:97 stop:480 length:384 start_codon:yes stop_codon:yes gene_type:complete
VQTEEKECEHHWRIESPSGPWSLGVCVKCNKRDAFRNSVEEGGWNPKQSNSKEKQIQTKENFLLSKEYNQIINTTKYEIKFINTAVTEALTLGRSTVRKKYGLPESTLRRWVTRYEQNNNIKESRAS